MFQRIVVPLDGTDLSSRALPYAVELAQKFSSELILISVVSPSTVVASGVEGPSSVQILVESAQAKDKQAVAEATDRLNAVARDCSAKGIKNSVIVATGAPAEEILKTCQARKADLVVMTTHGRTGIKRAVLGSVTDAIARSSVVPVLVIRPERQP